MLRRLTATLCSVLAVALAISAGATASPHPPAASAQGRVLIERRVDLQHVEQEAEVAVTLGAGQGSATSARNGSEVALQGNANTTGLLTVSYAGRIEGLQIVSKQDGVTFNNQPVDEKSTAVAMMWLTHAMGNNPVLTDGIYVAAAYKSALLAPLVAAMQQDREAGGDPIEAPSDAVVEATLRLVADVDGMVQEQIAPGDGSGVTREPLPTPADSQQSAMFLPASVTLPAREYACESTLRPEPCGQDEVYVNSRQGELNDNDLAALKCVTAARDTIIDVDTFEGDQACFVLSSREPGDPGEASSVNLEAINFSPRWLTVYESTNRGWFPDAFVAPKTWTLPSAIKLAELLGRGTVVLGEDVAEALLAWAGIQVDIGSRDNTVRYFQEVVAGFATNGDSAFALPIDDPGSDILFSSYGVDIPASLASGDHLEGLQYLRPGLATVLTVITEFAIPAFQLALDLQHGPDSEEVTRDKRKAAADIGMSLLSFIIETSTDCANDLQQCFSPENLKDLVESLISGLLDWTTAQNDHDRKIANTVVDGAVSSTGKADAWREAQMSAGETTLSGGLAAELWLLVSGVTVDNAKEAVAQLGIKVVESIALALAKSSTPIANLIKAYDIGSVVAQLAIEGGELIADSQNMDVIDHYRIPVTSVTGSPTSDEVQKSLALPRSEPVDLVMVLDSSGSMQGEKQSSALDAAEALASLVKTDSASGESRLGVVSFSDSATVVLPLTPVSGVAAGWRNAIPGADGGTNIGVALQTAISMLRAAGSTDRAQRILLLTDGEDNQFGTDNILNMLVGFDTNGDRDSTFQVLRPPLPIDTVAFDFQAQDSRSFLDQIAAASGGHAFSAGDALSIAGSFIKSRVVLQGRTVAERTGAFNGATAVQTVTVGPDRTGRLPEQIAVTAYAPGGNLDVTVLDPTGSEVEPGRVEISSGLVARVFVDRPEPGTWTFRLARSLTGPTINGSGWERRDSAPVFIPASEVSSAPSAADGYWFLVTRGGLYLPEQKPAVSEATDAGSSIAPVVLSLVSTASILLIALLVVILRRYRTGEGATHE